MQKNTYFLASKKLRKGYNNKLPFQKGKFKQKKGILKSLKDLIELISIFEKIKPEVEIIYAVYYLEKFLEKIGFKYLSGNDNR